VSGYTTATVTFTDHSVTPPATTKVSATCAVQDTRIGAAVPVSAAAKTYSAAISAFRGLVGQPLTLYRVENI
jgi:hypothetical protein